MKRMPINQLNVDQCSHFLQYLGLPDRRQSWFKKGIRPLDGKLLSLLKDEQDLLDFYPKKKVPRLVLREVAQRLKEEFIPKGVSKSLVGNDTTEKVPLHQQDILVPVSNFKNDDQTKESENLNYFDHEEEEEEEQFQILTTKQKETEEETKASNREAITGKRSTDSATIVQLPPAKQKKVSFEHSLTPSEILHNSDKTVDEGITSIKSSLTHPTATKLTNESVFKKLKKLEDPDAIIEYLQLLIMRLGPTGRYLPKTIEQITREKGYIVLLDIIYDENFASHTEIRKAANQAMTLYLDQIQLMQQSALSVSIMLYDILQYYLNAEKSDALYPTLQVIRKTITRMKRDKFRNISVDFHRNKGDEKLLLVIEKYANTTRSDVANKTMVSQQSISDEKAGNDLPSVEHNAEEISQDIRETVHEMLAKLSKIAHPQQTEIEILDNLFTRLKGRSALSTAIEIATDQGYLHIINFIRNISLSSELSLAVVRRASEIYSLWIDVMKMTNAHNQFNAFVQILNYLVQIKQNRHIKLLEQVITVTMEATKDYLNHYPSFQLRFEQEHGMDKLKKLKGMILQGNNHNIIVSSSETYQIK